MKLTAASPLKWLFSKLVAPQSNCDQPMFTRNDRIVYLLLTTLAGLTLAVARFLKPSQTGVGTHEQLGLPPCFFLHLTGIPCPGCGLTTCFAHSVRLHFYQAFITQPFGLILFALTVASIPMFLVLLLRRVPWSTLIYAKGADYVMYFLIAACLLSWLYKISVIKGW
jgi:hypothetical protein